MQQEVVWEHSAAGNLRDSLTAQEAAMRILHADLESKQDEIAAKHVQLVAAEGEAQCCRLQLLKEQAQLSALRQELESLKVPAQIHLGSGQRWLLLPAVLNAAAARGCVHAGGLSYDGVGWQTGWHKSFQASQGVEGCTS